LPWPIITFILLTLGVLLLGWTFQTQADDIHVTAKVSAPLPSGAAVITSPGDGSRFTSVPITVSGTCPVDTYIKLYRNNFFSGTVVCTTDGNFSLETDLFPGANKLEARVFNLTDDEGPQPVPVTVYYDVPEQPYALNIDWGDGTNTLLSQKDVGKVTATHRYKKVGNGNHGSYLVKTTGTDSQGRQSFLQLFLVIVPAGVPGFVSNTLPAGPKIDSSWLKLIWPAYFVVILMALSFWLGEREELIEIRQKRLMRKRHI
jgi:hypothetical protein